MKSLFHFPKIYYYSSIIWVNLLIVLFYGLLDEGALRAYIYNTDYLIIPSLYQDLFIEGNALRGWHLTPAPYFFPDMMLYFLIRLPGIGFHTATILFSCIQVTLLLVLSKKIMQNFWPGLPDHIFAVSNLLMGGIVLTGFYGYYIYDIQFLLGISNHTGAFINFLLVILCIQLFFRSLQKKYLVLTSVLIILSVISDKLFLIMFFPPLLLLLVIYKDQRIGWRNLLFCLSVIALSVVAGLLLLLWIKTLVHIPTADILLVKQKEIPTVRIFWQDVGERLRIEGFQRVHLIISILTMLLMIFLIIQNSIRRNKKSVFKYTYWWVFISILFLFPGYLGLFKGVDCARYHYAAYLVSLFLFPVVMYQVFPREKFSWIIGGTGFVLLLLVPLVKVWPQLNFKKVSAFIDFYPETTKILDENHTLLMNGAAGYWDTKFFEIHSKKGIKIRAVKDDFMPFLHESNSVWYAQENKKIPFNFFINITPDTSKFTIIDTLFAPHHVIYITEPFCFSRKAKKDYVLEKNCL